MVTFMRPNSPAFLCCTQKDLRYLLQFQNYLFCLDNDFGSVLEGNMKLNSTMQRFFCTEIK